MNILLRRRKLGNGSCNGIKAASTTGIEVFRNDQPLPEGGVQYVFRWGCTSTLDCDPEHVINRAASIHWCSNKRQGRIDMQEAGVSVPTTWVTLESMPIAMYGKIVLRKATHAQGRDLWVYDLNDEEQRMAFATHTRQLGSWYAADLIDKVAEYRVAVIQNRVAWVAKKTPGNPDQVAWNVAQGGRFDNVRWSDWPKDVVKEALKAAKVSGTDFCGVDVMTTEDGKAYVLEVNSAPSQTSAYRQQCFAKCFDYIVTNGKAALPDVAKYGWKSTIHPALLAEH